MDRSKNTALVVPGFGTPTSYLPAIGLTVKVYQGTYSAALKKGAGHFINTSVWDGTSDTAPAYTQVSKEDYSAVKKLIGRMEGVLRYEHHIPQGFTVNARNHSLTAARLFWPAKMIHGPSRRTISPM